MELIINKYGEGLEEVTICFSTLTEKWNVSGYNWEANGFKTYEEAYRFAVGGGKFE